MAVAGLALPLGSVQGGITSTVVGGTGGPGPATSVAVSPCGMDWAGSWLYIGDGSMVRRVSTATGALTTVAGDNVAGDGNVSFSGDGGPAVKAGIVPQAVATDAAGDLIIADVHVRVRLVAARTGTMYGQKMTAGHIYTIAGSGAFGSSGNGGPARKAKFELMGGVTTDRHGNVIFTDPDSGVVWVVAVTDGTFYGQAMTAGDIYDVAGGGTTLGDGGPATSVQFSSRSPWRCPLRTACW